jgi:flagellar biosynthesis/type III secretory pathway protein FliH
VKPSRARIVAAPAVPGRRVPREVVAATDRARAVVAEAEREAASVRLQAQLEGRSEGAAAVAALAVALAAREARADERGLDRSVELAVLLAERLLGEALGLRPERVVALARQALREARANHEMVIGAHPEDARILEAALDSLGCPPGTVRIEADTSRARGSLRLVTEAGVLDGALAPQLERLAARLREALSS